MSNGSNASPPITIVNTYLLAGGGTVSGGSVIKRKVSASWSFPTRYPKPYPLSDTAGVITRTYQNTARYQTASRRGSPDFVYNGYTPVIKNESSENELTSRRLRAGAKLGAGPLNLGVAAAESIQTANMITNRLRRIAEGLYAMRKGNWRHLEEVIQWELTNAKRRKLDAVKNVSQRLAAGWLETSLGWRPFVQDIYGGMEAYHKGLTTRGAMIRVASGKAGHKYESGTGRISLNGDGTINYANVPLMARAVYRGRVINPGLRSLQELGLINPLGVIWEKIPLSFVVDWVLPLGNIFHTMTAGAGLSEIRGCQIFERRSTVLQNNVAISSTQRIERQPISLSPFVLPNYNIDLSVLQIVTASALVRQHYASGDRKVYYRR